MHPIFLPSLSRDNGVCSQCRDAVWSWSSDQPSRSASLGFLLHIVTSLVCCVCEVLPVPGSGFSSPVICQNQSLRSGSYALSCPALPRSYLPCPVLRSLSALPLVLVIAKGVLWELTSAASDNWLG